MQAVLVYLQPFRRNSVLKCALHQKIAKNSVKPYLGVQGRSRSSMLTNLKSQQWRFRDPSFHRFVTDNKCDAVIKQKMHHHYQNQHHHHHQQQQQQLTCAMLSTMKGLKASTVTTQGEIVVPKFLPRNGPSGTYSHFCMSRAVYNNYC